MTHKTIDVQGIEIALKQINDEDYISLTDMCGAKDSNETKDAIIRNWLRRRDTLDYLATWEMMYNPNFNPIEFDRIRKESGTNRFVISLKEWIEKTAAKGIVSKPGRYGGTFAHRDIAFNFGMWISPQFQLYVVKEYQRLKAIEQNSYSLEWDARRELAKTNYRIHTDAIKESISKRNLPKWKERWQYADEADIINLALFGTTAKEWSEKNPTRALNGENVRDSASINELIVLSNLESYNAVMIKENLPKQERLKRLRSVAVEQLDTLNRNDEMKSIKKLSESTYIDGN